jgi:hypothetical protein
VPNIKRFLAMALEMSRVLATMVHLTIQDLALSGMNLMVAMGKRFVKSLPLLGVRGR